VCGCSEQSNTGEVAKTGLRGDPYGGAKLIAGSRRMCEEVEEEIMNKEKTRKKDRERERPSRLD
jgi:hypothetical protein